MDTFLVGDGSARLMRGYVEEETFSRQLVLPDAGDSLFDVKDDLKDYDIDIVEISERSDIEWAFHEYKKEVYDIFKWVELKSSRLQGVPIKLEDLVMEDADKYLIDYLVDSVHDLSIWKCLAKLQACVSLNIEHVRVVSGHDCPMCKALSGEIRVVEDLLRLLCRGSHPLHIGAPVDLIPVVYREKYQGPLIGNLDELLVFMGHRDLINVPREIMCYTELNDLGERMSSFEVEFVNLPLWCERNKIKDSQGLVVYVEDETMYVHNSYVGNSTPVDYIKSYLEVNMSLDKLDNDTKHKADAYWMNGREVLKYNGAYYDATSLERI